MSSLKLVSRSLQAYLDFRRIDNPVLYLDEVHILGQCNETFLAWGYLYGVAQVNVRIACRQCRQTKLMTCSNVGRCYVPPEDPILFPEARSNPPKSINTYNES